MTVSQRKPLACLMSLIILSGVALCRAEDASPADELQTLPGFKVDVVMTADKATNGSWISMTTDDKGRLLIAGQRREPVTRLTLKDGKVEKQEILKLPISEIMGMLYTSDSLYVDGYDGHRDGLFRLRDTKGDGQFDSIEFLREWPGGTGDHGAHAILLSPDKKKLFLVCGNFVKLPTDLLPTSPHRNYADDMVLPRAEDGNGFGAGNRPPGGFVVSMDLDGKNPSLFCSGLRNTYDIAFNADGELFLFDSDMEWDWGTPWYRPIRVIHAVSAGDYGFREGTAKWPFYYPDSLPGLATVGLGSPTGVLFGAGAEFPAKYQKALYVLDWTYGRLIAVHLTPDGSTYSGQWENFVAPKSLHATSGKTPLDLTYVVIGNDGAMYFTIGGRNTQSRLYRVTYTGDESTAPAELHDAAGADQRELRHKLEALHGHEDAQAVETAWPYLGSEDRFLSYAARIAVEAQPVDQWKQRALSESKPRAAITALLALARLGNSQDQSELFKSLSRFPLSSLPETEQLDKLRVLEVSISRQGRPAAEVAAPVVKELDAQYPAKTVEMNRELCQVLLALEASDAVARTVKLLDAAPTLEEQVGYVQYLRTIKTGWTPELRREYFAWFTKDHARAEHPAYVVKWFEDAGRPYDNGSSFNNFLAHFHQDAENTLNPNEKQALADVLAQYVPPGQAQRGKPVVLGKFVKEWKMADLEPSLAQVSRGRNFERGKQMYEAGQCMACHKFGSEGGAVGPDLTAVSSRFNRHDILESILLPSKVISEQYTNTIVRYKAGGGVVGRIVEDTPDHVVVQPSLLLPEKITVKKADIKSREISKVSPMPEGLVNNMSKGQILDLLAYIESGGRKDNPDFRR